MAQQQYPWEAYENLPKKQQRMLAKYRKLSPQNEWVAIWRLTKTYDVESAAYLIVGDWFEGKHDNPRHVLWNVEDFVRLTPEALAWFAAQS